MSSTTSTSTSTSTTGALAEIERAIATIGAAASVAVVSVGRNGRGTGFVVAPNRVLTSAHNLRDQTVSITFADSRTEQGSVHAVDGDGDLVVIDVPTAEVAPLSFAESLPTLGAAVVAIGRGGHRTRTTLGFVSGLDRAFHGPRGRVVQGSLEHTAPLARGSSGGPVFDVAGAVVGINTHRIGDGFYLARPADASLQARISELVAGHSVQRRTLGIAVAPADVAAQLRQAVGLAQRDGVLVRAIDASGPAGRAGVLVGDLIVRLGSTDIAGIDDLQNALAALTDDTVEVALVRGADEVVVAVGFTDPS